MFDLVTFEVMEILSFLEGDLYFNELVNKFKKMLSRYDLFIFKIEAFSNSILITGLYKLIKKLN